jgi:hypothetical protein
VADTATLPPPAGLRDLAHQRLEAVVRQAETSTLDEVMRRLFDRNDRDRLTYSAFGSAL